MGNYEEKLNIFQKSVDIIFNDPQLLRQVFVHRSYLNEHKGFELDHNERLEFLGDAVLELVTTEYLYLKYKDPEGTLTNWRSALVKGESLSELAGDIGLNDLMLLSKGESKGSDKSRKIILANAMEAFIGAVYLDRGYEVVKKFIHKSLIVKLDKIIEDQLYIDAKSKLQELAQEKFSITPHYDLVSESGPDHNKKFFMACFLDNKKISDGEGRSKQEAEQSAAKLALELFDKIELN